MFDENSGSPTDRHREKGRLNSAKIETWRWVEDKRQSRSGWKTEEDEGEEEEEEGGDETGGGPIGQE